MRAENVGSLGLMRKTRMRHCWLMTRREEALPARCTVCVCMYVCEYTCVCIVVTLLVDDKERGSTASSVHYVCVCMYVCVCVCIRVTLFVDDKERGSTASSAHCVCMCVCVCLCVSVFLFVEDKELPVQCTVYVCVYV